MLYLMNQTHLILERIFVVDDDAGELVETNAQEENANKPLELEDPKKEEDEEMPQPTLKYDLPKDWQFKKAHPQDLIIGNTIKG